MGECAGLIARKVKADRKVEDIDLFGPVVKVSRGGVSNKESVLNNSLNLVFMRVSKHFMVSIIAGF